MQTVKNMIACRMFAANIPFRIVEAVKTEQLISIRIEDLNNETHLRNLETAVKIAQEIEAQLGWDIMIREW